MKVLSVVFSFRNEEENIKELIERVVKAIEKIDSWSYELIFVNDASNDKSEEILIELQNKYPIKIINMTRNFGVGPCVLAGFENSKGDCVIYMDCDLQDPPELIPDLIKEYKKGNEVVHTVRIKRDGESKIKLIITKFAYKIINLISDINLPIEAGDFKLISRKVIDKILNQKEYNPYIRGMAVWVGYSQSTVKYKRLARSKGDTHFSLFGKGPILEFLRGITSYSLKPLYIGLFFGLIGIILSIILSFYALYLKLNNLAVSGTSGILISISFFSGSILLTLGIIGIYVGKIFEQTKGRDRYIIKDIKSNIK